MYAKTKAFTIFAIIAATGLMLVTAPGLTGDPALAVKTSTSHKSKSSSSSGTSASSSSSPTSSSSSSSKELKNLVTCETTSAKGVGGLTQNQVLNCYSQAFPGNATSTTNSTASTLATGGNSSSTNSGGSSSGSSSGSIHHGSSSSNLHHHSSGK